jgi:serine/threonine-protein kinase
MSGDDDRPDSGLLPTLPRAPGAQGIHDATEPAPSAGASVPPPTLLSPRLDLAPPESGRILSEKYLLLDQLGEGGMGRVYKGEHLLLGVPVAIKTMHPHIAVVEADRRRFLREARAASLLRHPNAVQVLDCAEDAGLPYLVMEYVEGCSLGAWLRDLGRLPPLDEVAAIAGMILDALDAAHAHGIVHRDLKPENVLLTEVGGRRAAKVTDFGLAHIEDPRDPGPTLTARDAVAGTPDYMSPEQCRSLRVGPTADLYAFGCVLTTLLQGRPPFSGGSVVETFTKHLFSPPPPLDRPEGAEPVPLLLERLRQDLLAKRPERRPQSAAEARARLVEAISPEAEAARLPGRKSWAPLGARSERAPSWDATERAASLDAAAEALREPAVGLLRAGGGGAVDEGCVLGLEAQGLTVTRVRNGAAIVGAGCAVVVIDAGGDIAAGCAALGEIAKAAPGARAVVCVVGLNAEGMSALAGAGAADVARGPVTADVLGRKIGRVLRRGR